MYCMNVWLDLLWQKTSDNLLYLYSPMLKKKRGIIDAQGMSSFVLLYPASWQPFSFVIVIDGVAMLPFFFFLYFSLSLYFFFLQTKKPVLRHVPQQGHPSNPLH